METDAAFILIATSEACDCEKQKADRLSVAGTILPDVREKWPARDAIFRLEPGRTAFFVLIKESGGKSRFFKNETQFKNF